MTQIRFLPVVRSALALILMVLTATACAYYPDTDTPVSTVAPPNALTEEKQLPVDPRTSIWRPGYWYYSYQDSDFTWIPGELIDRPSPTAVWVADHWIHHTYGWAFVPGYWQ